MKVLFAKQQLDLVGPRQSFAYADDHELEILRGFQGKVSLWEMLCALKADFLITPTLVQAPWLATLLAQPGYKDTMQKTTPQVINPNEFDFGAYDVVITHDSFLGLQIDALKAKFPKTVFAYLLAEHSSWQMHRIGYKYDLYLDHTLESVDDVVRLPQAVNFLFPRIPNKVRELFQQDKTSAFLDYRTLGYFIGKGSNNFLLTEDKVNKFYDKLKLNIPIERISNVSMKPFMFDQVPNNDSIEYYSKLCRTKYFFTVANRVGQAAFDAASANCIVFGNSKSKLHKLLCHPFTLMEEEIKIEHIKDAINTLENDQKLCMEILDHQNEYLYKTCVEHPINVFKKALELK